MTLFKTTLWTEVQKASENDPGAVASIVRKYGPAVHSFMRARGVDDHTAEDVTQEVFVRLFVRGLLKRADPRLGRFRNLVRAVAHRVLLEELRRRPKIRPLSKLEAVPSSEDLFDRLWLAHLLETAVERLRSLSGKGGARYGEALDLYVRHSLSYAEIAGRLGCSEPVARTWVYRARRFIAHQLRRLVQEYSSSSEDFEQEMKRLSEFLP